MSCIVAAAASKIQVISTHKTAQIPGKVNRFGGKTLTALFLTI
jgi:hypothetical protein